MRRELLGDKLAALKEYFHSNNNIATVYLFGSFGTPNYNRHISDIDLAILFFNNPSLKDEMKISAEISMLLESDNIDIVNLNNLRVDISHEILCTGEIIYEKNNITTAEFVEQTLKNSFDHGFTLNRMKEEFFDHLKEEIVSHDK